MASKPPGVLGTASNPGNGHNRTTGGHGNFHPPGVAGSSASTLADLEHRATALAHSVATAMGWHQTRSAAYNLIGQHSFTAGVVVGMGENLAKTVVAAVDLLQTLALAEYWESRQDHSFMARMRSSAFFSIAPGASLGMVVAGHFWPGFDRKAQDAYEERGAIADAIKHAFTHPKEFLESLTKAQEAKAREFVAFMGQQSLSGNFHAGVLMGELLFDLLMVIDLAVGLAKLAMAVPKLARYAEDLARLAREFRAARQIEKTASELVEPGPRITQAQKNANASSGRGPSSTPSRPDDTPPVGAERDFTNSEKGVYGEAMSDEYMQEGGFQKLNGDIVQVGDAPLGQGIDGVWKNTSPPPEYVVTESKYGSSTLSTLKDGTKQMSDKWVNDRLDASVGREMADDIRDADSRGQVEKWLLNVDSNGNVSKTVIPGD